MSNCDVGSGGFRLPCNIVAQHGIESCDHLMHDGDDDEGGIISSCTESGHVKDVTDRHATAVDAAMPPAIMATKNATRDIPIVMAPAGDPLALGFVASLARPGGNITGLSAANDELGPKASN